jgi:hypothetical protein
MFVGKTLKTQVHQSLVGRVDGGMEKKNREKRIGSHGKNSTARRGELLNTHTHTL